MQVTRARATSALAEAQRKKADLDQAALNLQYTKIVAPVNGVVSNRSVEVGQNVAPGQELMKVINLDDVWITANFKETQLRQMKSASGSPSRLTPTAEPTTRRWIASPARAERDSVCCHRKMPREIT